MPLLTIDWTAIAMATGIITLIVVSPFILRFFVRVAGVVLGGLFATLPVLVIIVAAGWLVTDGWEAIRDWFMQAFTK